MKSVAVKFLLLLLCVGLASAVVGQEKDDRGKDKKDAEESLVKELQPGIRVYGVIPEFNEVGPTIAFDVNPDGETIALCAGGKIKFWDIEDRKVVGEIKNVSSNTIRFSGDGLSLIAMVHGSNGMELRVYDAITHDVRHQIDLKEAASDESPGFVFHAQGFCVSPDDSRVAIFGLQNLVIFDLETGEKVTRIKQGGYNRASCFNKDGTRIVTASGKIYDVDSGEETGELAKKSLFRGGQRYINAMSSNPRTGAIVTAEWNQGVGLYDLESKKKLDLEKKEGSSPYYYHVEFSGNGKLLAATTYAISYPGSSGVPNAELHVWDAKTGDLKYAQKLQLGNIQSMRFAADSESVFVLQPGQFGVTEINFAEGGSGDNLGGWHQTPVFQLGFLPDGDSLYAAPQMGAIVIHDLETGEPKQRGQISQASHVVAGGEGTGVVVAANYNQAHIVKVKSGKVKNIDVQSFQRSSMISQLGRFLSRKKKKRTYENFFINSIVVAKDRESFYLAMRSEKSFRLDQYKLKSGERQRRVKFDGGDFWPKDDDLQANGNQMQWRPHSASVSSDGKYFAILDESRKVYVINAEDESLLHEFEGGGQSSWPGVYFSPDNTKLFVLAESKINVYGVESGEEEMSLDIGNNNSYDNRLVFSDDGNRLAAIGQNNTVKVFDLQSGDEVFSRKCKGANRSIAISPDGEMLALGKNNCQFEVWDLTELESDKKGDK